MDFKFSKESADSQQHDAPGEKKNQSALLVLLLILVGGFTYLYFFTDLIKPLEAKKSAEVPAPAPQAVKIPLPPRDGESAKPETKVATKAETPKVAIAAPAAVPPPAPTAQKVPAPLPAKPKAEPQKAETVKPADKKPLPPMIAFKKGEKPTAANAEEKKPVVAEKSSTAAKEGIKKQALDKRAKQESVVKTKAAVTGPWSLTVGNYILEETLSADLGRVRKAGLVPVIKPSTRKKTAMNRLFVSESNDRATALSTLEKLKRHTSDAFVIEQGGKFAVYAGSYAQNEAANSERERLKSSGFSTTVRHADIAIPSQSLSVGPFRNKKDADAALGKLKAAGINATLSQK